MTLSSKIKSYSLSFPSTYQERLGLFLTTKCIYDGLTPQVLALSYPQSVATNAATKIWSDLRRNLLLKYGDTHGH
jgi:hypothetical protein